MPFVSVLAAAAHTMEAVYGAVGQMLQAEMHQLLHHF
jgi:hypothetical protein